MNPKIFIAELQHEFWAGLRSPLVPLIGIGVIGYLVVVLLNAEYAQQMGATDIPRNSPHIVYLMTAGQGFWMFFSWAWMYSRIIARDGEVNLHELSLACPVSLRGLLLARFAGVFLLACILGLSSPIGFFLVHPLEWMGLLQPADVGAVPIAAMTESWLLYAVPSALGMGSLFLAAAIRTRNATGPFAVAATIMLIWMMAMVIVKGAEMDPLISNLIDPLGYSEVEYQADDWTPADKMRGVLELSPSLILNRILWCVLPVGALIWSLWKVDRESLVLGRGAPRGRELAKNESLPSRQAASAKSDANPNAYPSAWFRWIPAFAAEARWHLQFSLRSSKTIAALVLMFVMGVAGSFVHGVAHGEGPISPRPEFVTGLVAEFYYLMLLLALAGFIGAMIRRDNRRGFDEIAAATSSPFGVRILGLSTAALALTTVFCMTAGFAGMVVALALAPAGFTFLTTPLYFFFCYLPALLEISGITIFIHSLVRSSGFAYALSIFVIFIFVVNQEIGLVSYPPAMVGLPLELAFSELADWSSWYGPIASFAALKLGTFLLFVGLAWLVSRREPYIDGISRLKVATRRLLGGAGVTLILALTMIIANLALLREKLIVQGGWQSPEEERFVQATWEHNYLANASRFSLQGGQVKLTVDPGKRAVEGSWILDGLQIQGELLHAEVPPGLEIKSVSVQGEARPFEIDADHLTVDTGEACLQSCRVELALVSRYEGWGAEGHLPWLSEQQAWLRATDVLPRLGIDPTRSLRAPLERRGRSLPKKPPSVTAMSCVAAHGVAPMGSWTVELAAPSGWSLASLSQASAPLDFALAWMAKGSPAESKEEGIQIWHGPSHKATAKSIALDLREAQRCLAKLTGWTRKEITSVLQAPRHSESAIIGSALWLAENDGWDIEDKGLGRTLRRYRLTQLLASDHLSNLSALRRSTASLWLDTGVAGWLALECVRSLDGLEAWNELLEHGADGLTHALGALEAPVVALSEESGAEWAELYSPLAINSWALANGRDDSLKKIRQVVNQVAQGVEIPVALSNATSPALAQKLLGKPRASDLAIAQETRPGNVQGTRWIWGERGWESPTPVQRWVRVTQDQSKLLPISQDSRHPEPFTALDGQPSFERSPADNIQLRRASGEKR